MTDVEIKLRPSQERLESMNVGMYRRATKGSEDEAINCVAYFMIGDDGRYMTSEAANELLDNLTMGELKTAFASLQDVMKESAAPKASETPSTNQPS